jgi:diphthamide synthase (EF-2-diphthine--ammonia ligase)
MDQETVGELLALAHRARINPAGEGGEYETFVLDAPFFRKRIEVLSASVEYREHRGIYRIDRARLVAK